MSNLLNHYAPDVTLPLVTGGGRFVLTDWRGHIVVLNFWSAECPWSRRADVALVYRQLSWDPKGVRVLGIASNRGEAEKEIRSEAQLRHIKYPIARDADQTVANLFQATVTPHFFILDEQGYVRYIGAMDDVTRSGQKPTTVYVDEAVTALLANRPPNPLTTAPFGSPIVTRLSLQDEARSSAGPSVGPTAKVSKASLPETAVERPAAADPAATAAIRPTAGKDTPSGTAS